MLLGHPRVPSFTINSHWIIHGKGKCNFSWPQFDCISGNCCRWYSINTYSVPTAYQTENFQMVVCTDEIVRVKPEKDRPFSQAFDCSFTYDGKFIDQTVTVMRKYWSRNPHQITSGLLDETHQYRENKSDTMAAVIFIQSALK